MEGWTLSEVQSSLHQARLLWLNIRDYQSCSGPPSDLGRKRKAASSTVLALLMAKLGSLSDIPCGHNALSLVSFGFFCPCCYSSTSKRFFASHPGFSLCLHWLHTLLSSASVLSLSGPLRLRSRYESARLSNQPGACTKLTRVSRIRKWTNSGLSRGSGTSSQSY